MIQQFNPDRLIEARKARGLTQEGLGEIIDKSKSTICKWEIGSSNPDAETIIKISEVLRLPVKWFALKTLQTENKVYQFRSNATATKTLRGVVETRLNWLKEISFSLEEWVDYPEVNVIPSPTRNQALALSDDDIEQYANKLRLLWKLGDRPIKDLIATIESNGIIVAKERIGHDGMDGVSTWIDRPFIWVAEDKSNFFRGRFDIAHELGHIILHKNLTKDDCLKTTNRYKEVERQAHLFATHFLAPRRALSLSFRSITLDNLLLEKKRWGMSVAALIMQYYNLGIISDDYKVRLFKNYSYRKWRKSEPYDDTTPVEYPKLMKNTIELLLNEGGFDKEDLIERTFYSETELEKLCSLPKGFFNTEKVVDKPRLRIL